MTIPTIDTEKVRAALERTRRRVEQLGLPEPEHDQVLSTLDVLETWVSNAEVIHGAVQLIWQVVRHVEDDRPAASRPGGSEE